jgi:23S rRNA (adenine2503-C2)-methyltransferase
MAKKHDLCKIVENKTDIRALSLEKLIEEFEKIGEAKFRAKQVYEWLWKKSCSYFHEMTNLSFTLRNKLEEKFEIRKIKIKTFQKSTDGTIKCAFELHDGAIVEGVLIPTEKRMTACVSSQVGCSLDCKFCATGYLKRQRNLEAGEIYDQVVLLNNLAIENYSIPLSNIVYMGMGEPLLNYNNMMLSVDRISSENGLGMSPSRITVSTAGIAKMIKKLGDEKVKFNLALSLHAATNEKRSAIMPINESNPLEELSEALQYFYKETGNQITLEYAVMNDTNDGEKEASDLVKFAAKIPKVKVNLIEYNPIDMANYKSPGIDKIEQFAHKLKQNGVLTVIRRSRGKDIDAACGQLANKN